MQLDKILPQNQDPADRKFVIKCIRDYPDDIKKSLSLRYTKTFNDLSYKHANLELLKTTSSLKAKNDFDDKTLRDLADWKAELAWKDSGTKREKDPSFHMRRLRVSSRREQEAEMLTFRMVNKNTGQIYCSNRNVRNKKQADARNANYLKSRGVKAKNQAFKSLYEIASEGKMHRTFETRLKSMTMADIAVLKKWAVSFTVVTLPSRMHPSSPKWDTSNTGYIECLNGGGGMMPDESHGWHNRKWQRVRAHMSKMHWEEGTDYMVMRTAEPHKDACPHYNYIIIGEAHAVRQCNRLLIKHCLKAKDADPKERNAKKKRVVIKYYDQADDMVVRKIVSYASKYALKTYLPDGEHRTEAHQIAAERAAAWRTTWGIKAYTFLGFPPAGLYRECRNRNYLKGNHKLIDAAVGGKWLDYHLAWIEVKADLKAIVVNILNKYDEAVPRTVGHWIDDKEKTFLTQKNKDTEIFNIKDELQLEQLNQGDAKASLITPDDIAFDKMMAEINTHLKENIEKPPIDW